MITISPNTSVSEWGSVSFSLLTLTSGSSTIDTSSYQWQFNGEDITDATASSYSIAQVLASDSGDYTLTWTGSDGGGEVGYSSSVASHLVVNPLLISNPTSSAGNRAIMEGEGISVGGAVFSSSIAIESYQWSLNGSVLAGETNASVIRPSGLFYPRLAGQYSVVAQTASGSVSGAANVLVIPQGAVIAEPFQWAGDRWI